MRDVFIALRWLGLAAGTAYVLRSGRDSVSEVETHDPGFAEAPCGGNSSHDNVVAVSSAQREETLADSSAAGRDWTGVTPLPKEGTDGGFMLPHQEGQVELPPASLSLPRRFALRDSRTLCEL
eukprot:TRINITY_DN15572_c0_g1_i2.p1 TRINITY_DN15572_c0_g1~~TRINITY_DN15572_c0_g1_i2.p1  ORF type:complete len:123 (+),score=11.57 TRINITY_DN15572_c0_g1_i2:184-552(+)